MEERPDTGRKGVDSNDANSHDVTAGLGRSGPEFSASALRRGEILIDRGYPRLRAWYPAMYALVMALLISNYEASIGPKVLVWLAALAATLALVVWFVRALGVEPEIQHNPVRRRVEAGILLGGLLIAAILGALLSWLVAWWVGTAVVFALGTLLIAKFEGNSLVKE